ncbi:hypothetical protein PO909_018260 [Leuciscus waleckii]
MSLASLRSWIAFLSEGGPSRSPILFLPGTTESHLTDLFGPAVNGFAEHFTAQESSQAIRHFQPKLSSSAAASSRQRSLPTQPQPKLESEQRQRSHAAKLNTIPKRQCPRPKVTLGLEPQKPS